MGNLTTPLVSNTLKHLKTTSRNWNKLNKIPKIDSFACLYFHGRFEKCPYKFFRLHSLRRPSMESTLDFDQGYLSSIGTIRPFLLFDAPSSGVLFNLVEIAIVPLKPWINSFRQALEKATVPGKQGIKRTMNTQNRNRLLGLAIWNMVKNLGEKVRPKNTGKLPGKFNVPETAAIAEIFPLSLHAILWLMTAPAENPKKNTWSLW